MTSPHELPLVPRNLPSPSDMTLIATPAGDVELECRRCATTWPVLNLALAMNVWYDHRCADGVCIR